MSNREPVEVRSYGSSQRRLRADASVFDPGRLLRILSRHWPWVVVPPLLLAAVGGILASRQDDRFEATTMIVLGQTAAQDRLSGDRSNALAERELQTEARLLNGPAFAEVVEAEIGDDVDFEARAVEGTDLVELTAEAGTANGAAAAADDISELYLLQRRVRIEVDLDAAAADLQQTIVELQDELVVVDAALSRSAATATGLLGDAAEPGTVQQDPALVRRQSRLEAELTLAEVALVELASEAALTNGDVRIAAPAIPPNERILPNPERAAVLWAMLGVLIGLGLVWLRDARDRRIRSTEDMGLLLDGLDFAGRIPRPDTSALIGPASMLVEEVADRFRVLASNSLHVRDEPVSIQVAGVRGGEGATFVAANLAATLAAGGWATVLVDADLAGGDVHEIFGVEAQPGLKHLLNGGSLPGVIQVTRQVHGLGVISTGTKVSSDVTLHTTSLSEFLDKLSDRFDVVVVDGPPMLGSGDATVLAQHVDKTILVAASDETTQPELELAAEYVVGSGGRVGAIALTERVRSTVTAPVAAFHSVTAEVPAGDLPVGRRVSAGRAGGGDGTSPPRSE